MQLDFTPEQEAQLSKIARHEGMNVEELAKDVLLRLIEFLLFFSILSACRFG